MKFYIAYGSNLNVRQMQQRCPGAELVDTGTLKDYALEFHGRPYSAHATIVPCPGSRVPVGIWRISAGNERALDLYEGVPTYYSREQITVRGHGKSYRGLVYIMQPGFDYGMPARSYFNTILEGYGDCDLDTAPLHDALEASQAAMDDGQSSGFGTGVIM